MNLLFMLIHGHQTLCMEIIITTTIRQLNRVLYFFKKADIIICKLIILTMVDQDRFLCQFKYPTKTPIYKDGKLIKFSL